MDTNDIIRTPFSALHPCERLYAFQHLTAKKRKTREERRWLRKCVAYQTRLQKKYGSLWKMVPTSAATLLGSFNVGSI